VTVEVVVIITGHNTRLTYIVNLDWAVAIHITNGKKGLDSSLMHMI